MIIKCERVTDNVLKNRLDKNVEEEDADVGGQGRLVVHHDHDAQAEEGSEERQPAVVVAEGGPPS